MKNTPPTPTNYSLDADDGKIPSPPDIRQSVSHTLLAAALTLINLQDPFSKSLLDSPVHLIVLIAMPVAAIFSWQNFAKKLTLWKAVPEEIRARITRTPKSLRDRAIAHMLMAALSFGLIAIGYIGHLIIPLQQSYGSISVIAILTGDAIVGALAVAVISRTTQDLVTIIKAIRQQ